MAARKNKRGRRRNRGRFSFLYVLLSFFLIAAALLAGSFVFFRADSITVEGNQRYTSQEIIDAAQVKQGDNLFRINRPRAVNRILSALPYIRDVSILPALPNRLVISVTESQPTASIQGAQGWFLMDARGKLLEQGGESLQRKAAPVSGITPLTPTVGTWLAVDQAEQTKLTALVSLMSALEAHELSQNLLFVDLTASNIISFRYTSRFTVEMPLSCDFDYKVRSLQYVVEHLEENETGLIDLTRDGKNRFIPD